MQTPTMSTLPLFFNLQNAPVIIIGGGAVAYRKAQLLAHFGAHITIVAPKLCSNMIGFLQHSRHTHINGVYDKTHLQNKRLIIAATDDASLHAQIFADANALNIPINVVDTPHLCTVSFGAIIDRSPVIIAVGTNGTAPVLARLIRSKIEALLPPNLGKIAAISGRFRQKAKRILPNINARRKFWERVFSDECLHNLARKADIDVMHSALADVSDAQNMPKDASNNDNIKMQSANDASSLNHMECAPNLHHTSDIYARILDLLTQESAGAQEGCVYLVGAGAGDADGLSFGAARLLQKADVVLYDALVHPSIVNLARRDADKIYVGKKRTNHHKTQAQINQMLITYAKQGKIVARLKGGDPFIFGRGGEELVACQNAGVSVEVVAGISAGVLAASCAKIPLTMRGIADEVRFLTATSEKLSDAPKKAGQITRVYYMGLHNLAQLAARVQKQTGDLPCAVVSKAGLGGDIVRGNLSDIAKKAAHVSAPAVVIVGDVVRVT